MKNIPKRIGFLLGCSVLLPLAVHAQSAFEGGPSVQLPLDQYLELRKKTEAPSVTTIEEVRLAGDLRKPGALSIRITGSSAGLMPAKAVLEQSEAFSLSGCEGGAMLQAQENELSVIPFKNRFSLECKLLPKINSELSLTVLNALAVRNEVLGSDLIARSSAPGRRELALARSEANRETKSGPVSATARYQVSVYPDDSRFQYQLTFYNPNKMLKSFELPLRNSESVQDFQTSLVYEEAAGLIRFKLPPGDSQATLNGKLAQGKFTPLLDSSQQFLLLENHPLLQLTPQTKARRVSISETGLAPRFSGALGFYIRPGEDFGWASRKLAVFESQGYTIDQARYVYFVPNEGEGIVEAGFSVNNKGTPDISLKIPGKVTYFEIDSVAQALYKDEQGQLLIHLPSGQHDLLVQYRPEKAARGLAGNLSEQLAKPETMISDLSVQVMVERGWQVLLGRATSDFRSYFSIRYFVFFLVVFGLYYRLFGTMGLMNGAGVVSAFGAGAVYLLLPGSFGFLLVFWAGGLVWRRRPAIFSRLRDYKIPSWKHGAAYGLVLFAAVMLFKVVASSQLEKLGNFEANTSGPAGALQDSAFDDGNVGSGGRGAGAQYKAKVAKQARAAAPAMAQNSNMQALKGALTGGAAPPPLEPDGAVTPAGDEGFQGIPARIRIPEGGRAFFFHQGLVEKDAPIQVRLALVSSRALRAIPILLLLAGLGALALNRRKVLRYYVTTA